MRAGSWLGVVVAVVAVVAVVGCSDDDATVPDGIGDRDDPLVDTQWRLESLEVDGERTDYSGAQVPTLTFDTERLSLHDGVNQGGGRYRLDGEEFSAGPLETTLIGSPEPPLPEHQLFVHVEAATIAKVSDDRLVMTAPDVEMVWSRGLPEPDPLELEGTSWRLTDIVDGDTVTNASLGAVPAVMTFAEEDTVEAYDGVNNATGTYRVDGSSVTLDLTVVTDIEFTGEALPQYLLFGLLPKAERAELNGATLTVDLEGGPSLRFESIRGGVTDN